MIHMVLCVKALLRETFMHILIILGCSFLYGLLIRLVKNKGMPIFIDFISIIFGLALLYFVVLGNLLYDYMLFVGALYISTESMLVSNHRNRDNLAPSIMISTAVYLTVCEYCYPSEMDWLKLRGLVMIAALKITSICKELNMDHSLTTPSIFEFFGYMLTPANVAFGPAITYKEYKLYKDKQTPLTRFFFLEIARLSLIGFACIYAASCPTLPSVPKSWLDAYCIALSFRCSHYFVCMLSELTMISAGFNKHISPLWGYTVVKPLSIEIPRSMLVIAKNWNLPMYHFLKTFFYVPLLRKGKFLAIFGTFAISSMFHGFNIEVTVILMNIAIFSYIQTIFRNKLAIRYSACVRVKSCRKCRHLFNSKRWGVIAVNALFVALSLIDLAYLGVLMSDVGNSYKYKTVLERIYNKWYQLGFLSHIIHLIYVFLIFII